MKNDNVDKDKLLEQFLRIGLDERTARNTIANNKVTSNLNAVVHEVFSLFLIPLSFFSIPSDSSEEKSELIYKEKEGRKARLNAHYE